ncbi:VOC family protein [Haloplanus sp. GCM10025708]|uniref:VOC family protein n=1 Tax=Haloferacaceae TaxID=1644056 RepID=UPI00360D35E6
MGSPTIDHVAFAWDDLDDVRTAAEDVGLPTDYGGEHGHRPAHNALTGFPDGSYLELLAPTPGTDPRDAGYWKQHFADRAGPCAWCVEADDVADAAKAAIDAGFRVDGPRYAQRDRPDGAKVEWDVAFQDGTAGPLPFAITDRTPRSYRIEPTDGTDVLTGVSEVVLLVDDVESAASTFGRRYRFPTPVAVETPFEGAAATVPGQPVTFVAPDGGDLADRLDAVGAGPCAYLLGTPDFDRAATALSLTDPETWGDGRVAWLDAGPFRGTLGVYCD